MTPQQEEKALAILTEVHRAAGEGKMSWYGKHNEFSLTMSLKEFLEIEELLLETGALDKKSKHSAPRTRKVKQA